MSVEMKGEIIESIDWRKVISSEVSQLITYGGGRKFLSSPTSRTTYGLKARMVGWED